ncbi:hypothetical protein [Roseibium sp. LAB1]
MPLFIYTQLEHIGDKRKRAVMPMLLLFRSLYSHRQIENLQKSEKIWPEVRFAFVFLTLRRNFSILEKPANNYLLRKRDANGKTSQAPATPVAAFVSPKADHAGMIEILPFHSQR